MKKQARSRFWQIYRFIVIAALFLIAGFLLFFYDYIATYESSQPMYAAKQYAQSITQENLRVLYIEEAMISSTTLESPEKIADAYCKAAWAFKGELTVQQDYASSTDNLWRFIIAKGDMPIASVDVISEPYGKYGFPVCRVQSASGITEHLSIQSTDYTIIVPEGSTVVVNGNTLHEQFLSETNSGYGFPHPLEVLIPIACDTYTITDILSAPEVRCLWNGIECDGKFSEGKWLFAYPDSEAKTFTISAPADALISVNGITLSNDYRTQMDIPYTYSAYDSANGPLPTKKEYKISGLLHEPNIVVELNGKAISGTVNGFSFDYPYPKDYLYHQTIFAPQNSIVRINGHILGADCQKVRELAYPELFSGSNVSVYMDKYVLSDLYKASEDIEIVWNGAVLSTKFSEEGRAVTYRALYPNPDNADVRTCAVEFCKDYFAYTAGGYKNTEENLSRVLNYLLPNSDLYKRITRSKESISFVTPVTKQTFRDLTVDTMEALSESIVVCSVSYDIEQWTYQVQRMYSGKLWLAFENHNGEWVLTHMLTDIK